MCPCDAPSSLTSSSIGSNRIGYFSFLVSWSSSSLLTLGLRYVGVKLMGASLLVSNSGMCCGDWLVDELPRNLKILAGVVIIAARPLVSNFITISSILAFSDIYSLHIVSSNNLENYRIRESNKGMGDPVVFIGFCLNLLPTLTFPTIVTLNVNPPSSLTLSIYH